MYKRQVQDVTFVGFSNYSKILLDNTFSHSFWLTVVFAFVSSILINVLAFFIALALTKGYRGTNAFRTVFFMPNLIGGIVLGYIWQTLLNGLLSKWGQPLLSLSARNGFIGMLILLMWQQIGYMMIIYIAGLNNVCLLYTSNPADVETVNAIKAKFDAEMGALRPKFATDKNICEFVKTRIGAYTDIDTTGVTVSVKYSGDTDWVGTDGIIHYRAQAPSTGSNVKNVSLIYVFEKNGAKAETKERTATIGWDCEYFNRQMQADKDGLTWAKIKGSNTDAAEVTSNLTLPQCMGCLLYASPELILLYEILNA